MACAWIPDLPVEAVLRNEPELRGRPLSIVDDTEIVSGFLRGLTVTQARALEPDLVVRELALESVHSAREALVDAALSISPRVELAEAGLSTARLSSSVFVDLEGTEALFPTRRGLLTAFETRLHGVELRAVRLGIGPTRTIASLAARDREGGRIVRARDAPAFLEDLPIELLEPSDDLALRLSRWGLRTLGELARLPRGALGARLGAEGVRLARRALGEDLEPFRPTRPSLRFEEWVDSDHALGDLESLAFVLRAGLDRLTGRLRVRGLAARELWLELGLESGRSHARRVSLGAPTTEVPVLLSLVRLALESDPPGEATQRIRLIATPGSVETSQLDLFRAPLPAPAELAVTVARLESLCGPDRVGSPGLEDSHRPDAARLETFETRPAAALRDAESGDERLRSTLALRAVRPPLPIRVFERDGVPTRVGERGSGERGGDHRKGSADRGVIAAAGPWRLFGEWWGEACFARDYFDLELDDGGVYRIYHNLEGDAWYLDGIYD